MAYRSDPISFSEFGGRHPAMLLEHFIEIIIIHIPRLNGNLLNGQVRMLQQLPGFPDPQLCHIFGEGSAQIVLEQLAAIHLINEELDRQILPDTTSAQSSGRYRRPSG